MIIVLAGVNGAGKSSIGGSALREAGRNWYNPDELAREMQARFPQRPLPEINAQVWREGRARLLQAVKTNTDFAFETTLGGNSMTNTLLDAIAAGVRVSVWYCGLSSAEQHIERVKARVARGGHDIPEDLIRSRYRSSMRNLCRLTPGLHRLAVYDNSRSLDAQQRPQIRRLLHMVDDQVVEMESNMPSWAKPVAAVCLRKFRA